MEVEVRVLVGVTKGKAVVVETERVAVAKGWVAEAKVWAVAVMAEAALVAESTAARVAVVTVVAAIAMVALVAAVAAHRSHRHRCSSRPVDHKLSIYRERTMAHLRVWQGRTRRSCYGVAPSQTEHKARGI